MTVPKTIIDKQAKLEAICEKYPQRIPPDVCADFLGISYPSLGKLVEQGRCPYAMSTQGGAGRNRFIVIDTLAFYNFHTQRAMYAEGLK